MNTLLRHLFTAATLSAALLTPVMASAQDKVPREGMTYVAFWPPDSTTGL
ncbi:hypothetical protein AU15_06435 [Marinobacter salarius]|uniref:Uncharacterized protein n=1 Tax=Marinobacter salarius TaxID=1420917 RepID=W5YV04_9GAMM|nr:hypothetical protein AU15_06435 [Marinobacter salarius]